MKARYLKPKRKTTTPSWHFNTKRQRRKVLHPPLTNVKNYGHGFSNKPLTSDSKEKHLTLKQRHCNTKQSETTQPQNNEHAPSTS